MSTITEKLGKSVCGQGYSLKPFITTMSWGLDYQMIGIPLKQVLKCRTIFGIWKFGVNCIYHGRIHLYLRWIFWHTTLVRSSPHLRGSGFSLWPPSSVSCSLSEIPLRGGASPWGRGAQCYLTLSGSLW